MMLLAGKCMKLEIAILAEMNQAWKDKYDKFPLLVLIFFF